MPIEPIKVPQNVQIEDRLIGPITIRQVAICLVGGGISFAIWTAFKKAGLYSPGHIAVALTPLAIASAFAFIKVQNLSLLRLILLLIEKTDKPSIRRWEPRTGVSINIRSFYKTQRDDLPKASSSVERDKLENLGAMLDEALGEEKEKETQTIPKETQEGEAKPPVEKEPELKSRTQEPARPVDRNRVTAEPLAQESLQSIDGVGPTGQQPREEQTTQKTDNPQSPSPHAI